MSRGYGSRAVPTGRLMADNSAKARSEKPDGLARPASLRMNCYGLTTRLKVPPNAVMPLPLPAGTGAPFDAGASFSLLNR